jgi:hypothetical protein
MSLLDDWLPSYDFVERHQIVCRASAAVSWKALHEANLADAWLARAVIAVRGLKQAPELTLDAMIASGFSLLAEEPGRELVLGIAGRFWTPTGGRIRADAATFRGPIPPGTARAAIDFVAVPKADGTTLLTTETRIACADAAARRRFRAYWFVIRPGSGLIRRAMLRAVRAHAERLAAGSAT